MKRDLQRAKQLRCAIKKNGFTTNDYCQKLEGACNKDEKIRVDSDFAHPADIIGTLKELNVKCIHYQWSHTNCDSDCRNRLNRWPILNQRQVCFLILSFERAL